MHLLQFRAGKNTSKDMKTAKNGVLKQRKRRYQYAKYGEKLEIMVVGGSVAFGYGSCFVV